MNYSLEKNFLPDLSLSCTEYLLQYVVLAIWNVQKQYTQDYLSQFN